MVSPPAAEPFSEQIAQFLKAGFSLLLAQQSQRVTHYLALSAKITSFDQ